MSGKTSVTFATLLSHFGTKPWATFVVFSAEVCGFCGLLRLANKLAGRILMQLVNVDLIHLNP